MNLVFDGTGLLWGTSPGCRLSSCSNLHLCPSPPSFVYLSLKQQWVAQGCFLYFTLLSWATVLWDFSRWYCGAQFSPAPTSSLFSSFPQRRSPAGLRQREYYCFHDAALCLLCWINRSTVRNFNQVEDESDLFDLGCTAGLQEKDKRQQPIKCYPVLILNLVRHSLGGRTVFSHSILLPPASASPAPHVAWPHLAERNGRRIQTHAKRCWKTCIYSSVCVLLFCVIAVDQLSLHTCAHRA